MVYYLRRRSSTKCGGQLVCSRCESSRLQFDYAVGDVDVYRCRDCNSPTRYQTTPFDPVSKGMSPEEAKMEGMRGMDQKELSKFGQIARAKQKGYIYIPGIGKYRVRRKKKKPKDM